MSTDQMRLPLGVVYLAGPMTGIKDYNFPAFAEATKLLRAKGYVVFSPAESDLEEYGSLEGVKKNFCYNYCLLKDLTFLCQHADTIALLPGWEASMGAKAERAVADALKLDVVYVGEWLLPIKLDEVA